MKNLLQIILLLPLLLVFFTISALAQINTFPYSEDFESGTCPPSGWSLVYGNGNGSVNVMELSTLVKKSGLYSFQFSSSSIAENYDQFLISPEITTSLKLTLSFYARRDVAGTENFKIGYTTQSYTSASDTSNFTWFEAKGANSASFVQFSQEIPKTAKHIAIKYFTQDNASLTKLYIDDISFTQIPACLPPTNILFTNITSNSVTVSFTENNSATSWKYIKSMTPISEANLATTTSVSVSSNPFTISGLLDAKTYYVYLQADCGVVDGSSVWTAQKSFKTACASVSSFPKSVGFESSTFFEDSCWMKEVVATGIGTSGYDGDLSHVDIDSYTKHSGSFGLEVNTNLSKDGAQFRLISPPIDASSVNTGIDVDFWWNHSSYFVKPFEGVQIQYSLDGTNWINVGDRVLRYAENSGWKKYSVCIPQAKNQNIVYIGFLFTSEYGQSCYMDDVTLKESPSCMKPSTLKVVDVTKNSAKLQWTANSGETAWNYIVSKTVITDFSTADKVFITSNPYMVTNLEPNTAYYAYVQADCGGDGSSEWTEAVSFVTPCVEESVPFTEDFNDYSIGVNNFPGSSCWQSTSSIASVKPYFAGDYTMDETNGRSLYVYMYGDNYSIAIAPKVSSNIKDLMVSFYYRNAYVDAPLQVGVITDPSDASTFVPVGSPITVSVNAVFEPFEVFMNTYEGADGYIALKFTNNSSSSTNRAYIDNFKIDLIPSCPGVKSLEASNVTSSSAVLNWIEKGSLNEWNLIVKTSPIVSFTGETFQTITEKPYEVSGLTPNTQYYFYMRSVCENDDFSEWESGMFKTTCIASTITDATIYFENFDSYSGGDYSSPGVGVEPDCWKLYTNNTSYSTGVRSSGSYFYKNSGSSLGMTAGSAGKNAYAFLPSFTNDLNTVIIKLWRQMESQYGGTLTLGYCTSDDGGTSFTTITTIPSVSGGEFWSYDLSLFNGTIPANARLVFNWNVTSSYYSVCIDDVSLSLPSKECNIVSYNLPVQVGLSEIDTVNKFVKIMVPQAANITAQKATFTLSEMAKAQVNGVAQVSGVTENNFTDTLVYDIVAQDNNYSAKWKVIVREESCVSPTSLDISEITGNSAVFSWKPSSKSLFDVFLSDVPVSDFSSVNSTRISDSTFTFNDLFGSTTYYAYVRANCEGDSSVWICKEFKTTCGYSQFPMTESFENSSFFTESCWTKTVVEDYADNSSISISSSNYHSGTSSIEFTDIYDYDYDYYDYYYGGQIRLETSKFNLTSVNNGLEVSFWFKHANEGSDVEGVYLQYKIGNGAWIDVDGAFVPNYKEGKENQWMKYNFYILDVANTDNVKIGFLYKSEGVKPVYFDDLTIKEAPTCMPVYDIAVSEISATSAKLMFSTNSMATGGYDVIVSDTVVTDFTAWTTLAHTSTFVYNVTSLEGNTKYYVYSRVNCGGGDYSEWSEAKEFTTPCIALAFPYYENFESYVGSNYAIAGVVPDCWDVIFSGNNQSYSPHVSTSDVPAGSKGLLLNASVAYGESNFVILPIVEGNLDEMEIDFKVKSPSVLSNCKLSFGYISDVSDATTFMALEEIPLSGSVDAVSLMLNNYLFPANVRLAFNWSNTSYSLRWCSIDDISLHALPSCPKPGLITFTNVSTTGATVNCNSSNATSWEYIVSEEEIADFTDVDFLTTTTMPFTITGLTNSSKYNFYIRSICGEGETSLWSDGTVLYTSCDVIVVENSYLETFNDVEAGIPNCWNNSEGTTTNEEYKWSYNVGGYDNIGMAFNIRDNAYGKTNFLKSAIFDLTEMTNGAILKFRYMNPSNADFDVYISTDGGVTYPNIIAENLQSTDPATTWTDDRYVEYFISDYTGDGFDNVCIVFKGESNNASTGSDVEAFICIDDFEIKTPPSCPKPTAITKEESTESSIEISWTENGDATLWQIAYSKLAIADFNSATKIIANNNPFTITGLESASNYNMYVRSICGEGDTSDWTTPFKANTECGIVLAPYTEDFTEGNDALDCWTVINVNDDDETWIFEEDEVIYYYDSYNVANDWLISPKIVVGNNATVKFDYRVEGYIYPERFSVWVITGFPQNYASATRILTTMTVQNESFLTLAPISLEDYVGQQIYIGIKCESEENMYMLRIDNFVVDGDIPQTYTITANAGENGSISPSGEVSAIAGTNKSFTMIPNVNYKVGTVMVDSQDRTSDLVDNVYTFSNITASHTIEVSFVLTSINENQMSIVRVYPNPTNGMLNIEADEMIKYIEVLSISGQLIEVFDVADMKAAYNADKLSNGIYFLRINTQNSAVMKRFTLER